MSAASQRQMIDRLRAYGIADARVLEAMSTVRRHLFIPEAQRDAATAYGDHPAPIGMGQTVSQPYIVAHMTVMLSIRPGDKVLEIGTGSGYQAAILAYLGAELHTIELIPALADHARAILAREGFGGVCVRTGDGYKGWPEEAPFDAIIVTAAPETVPEALVEQLAEGGRMILPLGGDAQRLVMMRKAAGRLEHTDGLAVRFVPMVHGKG